MVVSHNREVGGAEVYLETLLRHLTSRGNGRWDLELVCRRDAAIREWAAGIDDCCASVFRLDIGRPQDLLRLRRRIQKAALVHINLSFPVGKYQFAAALMARGLGRPLVVTHHLALPVGAPWRQLMTWLGRAARQHIAVSRHSRKTLMREYGYPGDRVEVVYNGIDAQRFRPATEEARSTLRQKAGDLLEGRPWGGDVLVVCTVARLSSQKGLFELIEAAPEVIEGASSSRIVVIGEGELHRQLAGRIRDRGLERHFFLTGALPRAEVAQWLAASDLFVLPSHFEAGPAIALMEAMACGCAVVATDVSGVDELITDETLGRLVPAQDPKALAAAILDLLSDPERRTAMAERARRKVLSDFTIETSLNKSEAILDGVLAESDNRGYGELSL